MLNIIDIPDGFRLFQPAPEAFDELKEILARSNADNETYIAAHPVPQHTVPITGTFVYAHAPDYPANTLKDDKKTWLSRLQPLCERGIDTIIMQAAAWKELEDCYYPSQTMAGFSTWNVIEPMLAAASDLRLQVFMGECGICASWEDMENEVFNKEIEWHQQCLEELHRQFAGGYHGYYFSSESGYHNQRCSERETLMARVYDETFSFARSLENLPILISPASFYYENQREGMTGFWKSVFSKAKPDIIAPQDSVGCMCTTLTQQAEMYRDWLAVTQALKCHLWANVELFQFDFPEAGRSVLTAANPDRIAFQCQAASAVAEKLICWEALAFPLP